jgi:radical SAM protein with 4Fe4S-binding SPASM domain
MTAICASPQLFRLDPGRARIVKGSHGAALYDFASGEVRSVPAVVVPWVQDDGTHLKLPAEPPPAGTQFVERLRASGLGHYQARDGVAAEPPPSAVADPGWRADFAWLELLSTCNLRCVHCYGAFGPRSGDAGVRLGLEDWRRVLHELRALGFARIQFIGGEPTLHPALTDLLLAARECRFEFVELFTNATQVDDVLLNLLGYCRTHLATTLYAASADIHDAVTNVPGSHQRTLTAIRAAREKGIPVRVACVVTSLNQGHLRDLPKLVSRLGATWGGADPVRPVGRGRDSGCLPSTGRPGVCPPFATSAAQFARQVHYHPCWQGKLAITEDGSVLPCVFAREQCAGNVRQSSLDAIVRGPLERFWRMSKQQIRTCQDCEFRFACGDCRPLAMGTDPEGRLDAPTPDCHYHPASGLWRHRGRAEQG